jgi:proteic killer suppression protein
LRLFFEQDDGRKLIPALLPRIRRILSAHDAADSVEGMEYPIFKLHPLKGKLRRFWAVTVRAN